MYYLDIRRISFNVAKTMILVGLFLTFSYNNSYVVAQTTQSTAGQQGQQATDPSQRPVREPETGTAEEKIRKHASRDIEYYMKPKNKRDCATRSNLFTAAVQKYKEGVPVNEVTDVKMFEPLFESIYSTLREKGIDQASMDNMVAFQQCVDDAKPHRDPVREQAMAQKYGGCKKLNALIVDTLYSIKSGKKPDTVFNKYKHKKIDLAGTQYEAIDDPGFFFIGQLYKVAQDGEFSEAVQVGTTMSAACML